MADAEPTATGAGGIDMNDIIKAMEYGFNPSKIIDLLYNQMGDNYRVHKFIQGTHIPFYSQWSGIKVGKMEDDEQLRYVSDLAKNTGINPRNWKYPIRMGYYGNTGSIASSVGYANAGIMNLYKTSTKKPPKKEYNFYGDYYRYKNHYSR